MKNPNCSRLFFTRTLQGFFLFVITFVFMNLFCCSITVFILQNQSTVQSMLTKTQSLVEAKRLWCISFTVLAVLQNKFMICAAGQIIAD